MRPHPVPAPGVLALGDSRERRPGSVPLGLTSLPRPGAAVRTKDEVLKELARGGRVKKDWGVVRQPGSSSAATPQLFQWVRYPAVVPEELGAN